MIDTTLVLAAVFLLLNVVVGLVRALRGPTVRDRLSAFLLFGTTGVALLLVLAEVIDEPALRDAALIAVVLAALIAVVRVQSEREDR